jgi:hypothetical protein
MNETRETNAIRLVRQVEVLQWCEKWLGDHPELRKRVASEHLKPQLRDHAFKAALAEFAMLAILAYASVGSVRAAKDYRA